MNEEFQFQQFFGGFISPFLFTIPRFGFFIGLFPRPFFFSGNQGNQAPMTIQRITEQEYMSMRRLGFMEVPVAMGDHGYRDE